MAIENFDPDTYDYNSEQSRYDDAVNGGEDSFNSYMSERFDTPDFDWNEWDTHISDN
ncbi:MAG: hypothetical protein MJY99_10195 [Fibrobacter sp.]|uniref:hypothetical protein n=1 Tax=Fibrobacter sp. TaxID=35828 RepID=UPI00388EB6C2|nr:hypothetical protein [Fibrobacter sp.]